MKLRVEVVWENEGEEQRSNGFFLRFGAGR
jgi:hypothetical protein